MAGKNVNEVVVAPGGKIYVSPVGTAFPADESAAVGGSWIDLGYVSEDGVTFRDGATKSNIPAWQALYPIRRLIEERAAQIEFVLRQWNKETIKLGFGGGTVSTPTAGHYKYVPPVATDGPDYRAMIVEWDDGGKTYRICIPKVDLADQTETVLTRTQAADLPLVFDVIGTDASDPWYLLTDDAAFS